MTSDWLESGSHVPESDDHDPELVISIVPGSGTPPMTLTTAAIVLALIGINGLYVAAEFAAVAVRRSRIAALAQEGHGLARALLTLEDPAKLDRYIAACQIGITLSSLILGAYGQATLARDLGPLMAARRGWPRATTWPRR